MPQQVQLKVSNPPQSRSKIRHNLGKLFFTAKRRLSWIKYGRNYAQLKKPDIRLPYLIYSHKTPLVRKLRNVDMWMQYNKITNLKLALQAINGLIIRPGETFSFWYLLGKPTRSKGFLNGMVLCNGSFEPGIGGGLCQLSNLIYWMTLHTPLTVKERWRHNYDVFPDSDRTQPFGCGATVVYNYIDLQICNNTDSEYQLVLGLDDDYLNGQWRSRQPSAYTFEVYEQEHLITYEWWGGYMRHNVINRIAYDGDGQVVADTFIAENHAVMMYEPMLSPKVQTVFLGLR